MKRPPLRPLLVLAACATSIALLFARSGCTAPLPSAPASGRTDAIRTDATRIIRGGTRPGDCHAFLRMPCRPARDRPGPRSAAENTEARFRPFLAADAALR
jgi:hypothetical protein